MLEHPYRTPHRCCRCERSMGRRKSTSPSGGKATSGDPGGSLAISGGGLKLSVFGVPLAGSRHGGGLKLGGGLELPSVAAEYPLKQRRKVSGERPTPLLRDPLPRLPPVALTMVIIVTLLALPGLAVPWINRAKAIDDTRKGKDKRCSRMRLASMKMNGTREIAKTEIKLRR